MKIAVIGTRGFPNIPGGVERHCEILYPLVAQTGGNIQLIVFRRKPYVDYSPSATLNNIRFIDIYVIRNKYFETIFHSFIASFFCLFLRPDIIHIHNIGTALVLPFLKLFGLRSVVTYHSDNYNHEKWGVFSKKILRLGEWFAGRLADSIIVVSRKQKENFLHHPNVEIVPNGVRAPMISDSISYLKTISVQPGRYILAVARFVPEKGLDLLVKAFKELGGDFKLVVAGDADHETTYSRNLKEEMAGDHRIVSTGYITGEALNQVYSHAGLFVLPSFHEGLPIALLEAMSYDLPVLVSDIPANREVDLPEERFFRCGDVPDLKKKIEALWNKDLTVDEKNHFRSLLVEQYNWDKIARQTIEVYERVLRG